MHCTSREVTAVLRLLLKTQRSRPHWFYFKCMCVCVCCGVEMCVFSSQGEFLVPMVNDLVPVLLGSDVFCTLG